MSDVTKRIFISLWCGVAIPFGYLLLLAILDSVFSNRLSSAAPWLLLPLTWIGNTFASMYHPPVRSLGDVFAAAMDVILVGLVGNFIFYSGLSFLILSVRAALKRRRQLLV